ncbi:MAG TPA: energy transducer TonB [Methylomirabilota bacterium]|nr:energy transducer TonB [Methylomirabilota bacterium]
MLTALSAAGAEPAKKPAVLPIAPGFDPAALRERLASVDSADVARACGNLQAPWAYRGPFGRERTMRSYGRHHADSLVARAIATHLLSATRVDTATKMASIEVECDPARAKPIYLLALHGRGRSTFVLLRFDVAAALCFDAEEPLAMLRLGPAVDSLWATLAELMYDDPLLRGERPSLPADWEARPFIGDTVVVAQLPKATWRVPPVFPPVAIQMDLSGVVMVQVLIGKDGLVKDAYVLSGHPVLRDDALEAVWQWKFKPALSHDGPVPSWVAIPVRFTMK